MSDLEPDDGAQIYLNTQINNLSVAKSALEAVLFIQDQSIKNSVDVDTDTAVAIGAASGMVLSAIDIVNTLLNGLKESDLEYNLREITGNEG